MEDEIAEEVIEETQTPEVEEESVEEESKETPEAEEEKIPVRPNASYIIERQKRTIDKLRGESSEESDPVTERLDRIEELALGQAEDKDLNDFFEREPNAKQYASKIKAYMQHDAYKGASPEVIYHHLDYTQSKAKSDSKRKAADLEAGLTKSVGSGIRDTRSSDQKTAEDIKNMSMKEFAEYDRDLQRKARS